jgi:hypothetical protein
MAERYTQRHCCPCGCIHLISRILDGVRIRPSGFPIKKLYVYRPAAIVVILELHEIREGTFLLIATALLQLDKAVSLTKTTITLVKYPHTECRLHAVPYDGSNLPNGYKPTAFGGRQVLKVKTLSSWSVK